ncbi:hypothetical protein [Streptomyces sp. NPDC001675]
MFSGVPRGSPHDLARIWHDSCTAAIPETPSAAIGSVAGRLSKGRLWPHDAPDARRDADGHLLSCAGSLEIVDLLYGQMDLPASEPVEEDQPVLKAPALF